jgi:hypothetical protein
VHHLSSFIEKENDFSNTAMQGIGRQEKLHRQEHLSTKKNMAFTQYERIVNNDMFLFAHASREREREREMMIVISK